MCLIRDHHFYQCQHTIRVIDEHCTHPTAACAKTRPYRSQRIFGRPCFRDRCWEMVMMMQRGIMTRAQAEGEGESGGGEEENDEVEWGEKKTRDEKKRIEIEKPRLKQKEKGWCVVGETSESEKTDEAWDYSWFAGLFLEEEEGGYEAVGRGLSGRR